MRREIREPVMWFMLVVEQNLRTILQAFTKQVPKAHSTGGRNYRNARSAQAIQVLVDVGPLLRELDWDIPDSSPQSGHPVTVGSMS